MLNKLSNTLNKISLTQLILLGLLGLGFFLYKEYSIFTALLISGITSSFYIQLINLGKNNKLFALLGFPIRLILTMLPCAILVHKLHSNLLALFIGFFISQAIYFFYIWYYSKELIKNPEA